MEKKVLTSLELYAVIQELRSLKGALIDKIYQLSSKELLIYLYKTGFGKSALKIDSGCGMYLTSYQLKKPPYPTSFCMFLRKYLNRAQITDIIQKGLERIIEIHLKTKENNLILILELFSKGNFILTDSTYKIINVANVQKWKTRTVKKGEKYIYPPNSSINLFELTYLKFVELFDSNTELVKFLASNLGLGGIYAEEVCGQTNIDKNIIVNKIDSTKTKMIFNKIRELTSKFEDMNLSPGIVKEDSKIIDAIPFKLSKYSSYEKTSSWNTALDKYYTNITTSKIMEKGEEKYKEELNKLNKILEEQKESLENYKTKSEKYSELAEKIYKEYSTITEILNKLNQAKKAGYSTEQLKEILEKEKESGIYEANLIKEINKDSVIIDLGENIEFLFNESIEKTAELFYEKAKELKAKIPGAERIIKETLEKIEKLKSKESEIKERIIEELPKEKIKEKEEWFEKFHWFYTSENKLAIGGRDATQNDILLKKYLEPKDLIFHTEMAGSPFFILKNGAEANEKELEEVATATVSYSRAWREGLSSTDAYYVRPEQVSKEAPSGEYIGKGAWMIRGKKNLFNNVELKLAIGITKDNKILCGPISAVAKKLFKYFIIKPGWSSKSEIAKKFIEKFNNKNKLDKIIRYLPAGDSTIVQTIS